MTFRLLARFLALLACPLVPRLVCAQGAQQDAPQARLRGFADFTATASSQRGTSTSFGIGQYVLFLTSPLTERIAFLGETVFEYDEQFVVDVERILITYSPNRYLRVVAGKHHTPIGYWNNAYHHGVLLQPTISRPQMFRFEDEGGILPIHTTGVLVSGRDLTRWHLGFDVLVGNGIGSPPTEDNDNAKSVTVALSTQITSALKIGASAYHDRIAAGTTSLRSDPIPEAVDQTLLGGYATFTQEHIELLTEYQHVANRRPSATRASATDAFYAYGGYRFGRLVPYARFDLLQFPNEDPWFTANDNRQFLVGARYDVAATVSTKLEIGRRKTNDAGSVKFLSMQVAVGF